jgi:hypothetical protein
MDARSKNLLVCLLSKGTLDEVLTQIVVICFDKSEDPAFQKFEQRQWRKASDRLVKVRDWCSQYGPGSNCR